MHLIALLLALHVPYGLPSPSELVQRAVHAMSVHRLEYECRDHSYLKTETLYDTKQDTPRLKWTRVYRMWYEDGASRQLLLSENGKPVKRATPESPGPDALAGLPDRYIYDWAPEIIRYDEDGVLCWSLRFRIRPDYKPDGWKEEALGKMTGSMLIDIAHGYIRSIDGKLSESYRKFVVTEAKDVQFRFWQKWSPEAQVPFFIRTEADLHYSPFFFVTKKERRIYEYSGFVIDGRTVPPPR